MSSLWRVYVGPETQLRLWVAISVVVIECLIAIWAARSQRHWFWRALAVWGGIMLLVPIRAWEPAWLFCLSSPLIVIFIRGGTWLERRYFPTAGLLAGPDPPTRYRYSLGDLLLFMLTVGLWLRGILEIVRHWQPGNWLGWLVTAVSVAVVASCAFACTRIPRRWEHAGLVALGITEVLVAFLVELPWLGMIAALAGVVAYFYAFDRRHWVAVVVLVVAFPLSAAGMVAARQWMRWQMIVDNDRGESFLVLLVAEVAFAIGMMVVIALVQLAISQRSTLRWRVAARLAVLIVLAGLVVPTCKVYRRMLALTPREGPVVRFEVPVNHHDEVLRLAKQIIAIDPSPLGWVQAANGQTRDVWRSTPGPAAMQSLLDEMMVLLDGSNAVPYDPSIYGTASYTGHVQGWRSLARSLQAEAKVTASAGDYQRSARLSLAIVRIADMLSRGGVASDTFVALALRRGGFIESMKVIDQLPPDQLRNVLAVLQRSQEEREEISVIWAREDYHDERVYGWHIRFQNAVQGDFDPATYDKRQEIYDTHAELERTTNILLQAHVAIGLFKHEHGRWPENLGELVPRYLASLPVNPNGVPLCYRVEGTEFVLYSVGWDGKDNGGQFGTHSRYLGSRHAGKSFGDALDWLPASYDFDLGMLSREERVEEPPPSAEPPPPSPESVR